MSPILASILNFAGPDMIVILLIVLLLFGAKKLPELARGMGRAVEEFSAARGKAENGFSPPTQAKEGPTKLVHKLAKARAGCGSAPASPEINDRPNNS